MSGGFRVAAETNTLARLMGSPVAHPLYFAIGDAEAVQAGVISVVPTIVGSYLSSIRATRPEMGPST
jgi:hypothetical protein